MFSGIVQRTLSIQSLEKKTGLWILSITLPKEMLEGLTLGASIALNGTCLTVCKIEGCNVWFDVMMATLSVTNLCDLRVGSAVNVERAARFGDDIGGHQLSGHVFGQTSIVEIERPENNRIIWFDIPAQFKAYIFDKGYIGLNGCSLTIAKVEETRFCVYLIPETLSITTFGELDVGVSINLEVDSHTQAVVDTVERMLLQRGLIK
jgi:riboflavin synthase